MKLLEEFNKEYKLLRDNDGNVSGAREANQWFESTFDKNLPLIQEFVRVRGECIDTWNEKAAFAFACESLDIG